MGSAQSPGASPLSVLIDVFMSGIITVLGKLNDQIKRYRVYKMLYFN